MSRLKLAKLPLFLLLFGLIYWAQIPFGALILLFCWIFVELTFWDSNPKSKTQKNLIFIYLTLIPTLLFWGAVHSFSQIYWQEFSFFHLALSMVLDSILCIIICYLGIFIFLGIKEAELKSIYQESLKKTRQPYKNTIIIILTTLVISHVPLLKSDYQIVIAIIMGHFVQRGLRLEA